MPNMNEPREQPVDVAEWRDWLQRNSASTPAVRVVFPLKHSGHPGPFYEDLVIEALRWGWIDGQRNSLPGGWTMLRFTPRRPGSNWAQSNKDRVVALEASGLMEPAGAEVVARARQDGSWAPNDADIPHHER